MIQSKDIDPKKILHDLRAVHSALKMVETLLETAPPNENAIKLQRLSREKLEAIMKELEAAK